MRGLSERQLRQQPEILTTWPGEEFPGETTLWRWLDEAVARVGAAGGLGLAESALPLLAE